MAIEMNGCSLSRIHGFARKKGVQIVMKMWRGWAEEDDAYDFEIKAPGVNEEIPHTSVPPPPLHTHSRTHPSPQTPSRWVTMRTFPARQCLPAHPPSLS